MPVPFAERFARHTSEARLLAVVAGSPAPDHVSSCAPCQARLAELHAWTAGVAAEAGALADEAFTAERLADQKNEILRRLENAGRSARVIAFPVGSPAPARRHGGQVLRWAAAAAVAGVMVGIGSMRLLDLRTSDAPVAVAQRTETPTAPADAVEPVSAIGSLDEAALLDAAYDRVAIDALQTIDDMTPRARDITLASMPRSRR
jgi:hypothetical protein